MRYELNMVSLRHILFFILLVLLTSCQVDKTDHSLLQGRWNMVQAFREGRPTTTLKDAYFEFLGDSILKTNLLQEDLIFKYALDGQKISQKGQMNIDYQILQLTKDSMQLYARIKKYDFNFFLLKDTLEAE